MSALEQLVREIAREEVHAVLAAIESPARDEWLDSGALVRRVEDLLRDDRDDGFLDEVSKAASLGPSRKPVHHLVEPEQLPHLRAGRRLFCDRARSRAWVERGGRAHVVEAERLCTATLPRLRSVEWQLVARERAALELLEPPLIRGGSS